MTDVAALCERFRTEAEEVPVPTQPDVGIIMGSDSDLEVMAGAAEALEDLGFEAVTDAGDPPKAAFTYETWVISAHRTPDLLYTYADTAAQRGLDVIIAGAGGKSADLPNMTASIAFPVPVIGVPVQEKSVDSVIGMPTGAPITAVDAGKSYNAGLSAAQILARNDRQLEKRLRELHAAQSSDVATVSKDLHEKGRDVYESE